MFSIIIPLYNKAPYIAKAIRSVAAQTFQDFELIIIDDGSTDIAPLSPHRGFKDTPLECLEQLKERATYIRQKNQGVSTARNNGVAMAKYDYIAFLDADDWWAPTYLEEMKALIEKYPEAGIYASAYNIVKNKTQRLARIGVDADFGAGIINYFKVYAKTLGMPVWTGATIIKKSIFVEQNGFKAQLKVGEDFDLWVRIAIKYPVAFVNKNLAYYNQDIEVSSSSSRIKNYLPEEHMLFGNYSHITNPDFQHLFQLLAINGLLPSYVNNMNTLEVNKILSNIEWGNHPMKYTIYYKILPKSVLIFWLKILKIGSVFKKGIKRLIVK